MHVQRGEARDTGSVFTGVTAAPRGTEWPGARRAWYVVLVLCLLATVSYLDRYIVAVVAEPLIDAMRLNSTHIGLLIGLGFGPVYALTSLPLAYILDWGNRVRIVTAGVVLWSFSTMASALAYDFTSLLLTRVGVAIGEAVLVPATVSIVADLFRPEARSRPIALFMSVSTLMTAGAFTLGGLAFAGATRLEPVTGYEAWRLTFLFVGLPGLLFALLWFATVREPRRVASSDASGNDVSMGAAIQHLRMHILFYAPFLGVFALSALTSYSFISWMAAILVRSYGMSVADAAFYYGTVGLVAAAAGAIFWPMIGGLMLRKRRPAVNLVALAVGLSIGHICVALLTWAATPPTAIVLTLFAIFGFAAGGGLAVLIVQAAAPPRMRAKITSFYMLMGNLIGLTGGAPLTAWMSENWFEGRDALRQSVSALAGVSAPFVFLILVAAAFTYRSLAKEAAATAD